MRITIYDSGWSGGTPKRSLSVLAGFCATVAVGAGFCHLGFRPSHLLGWICFAACFWGWWIVYEFIEKGASVRISGIRQGGIVVGKAIQSVGWQRQTGLADGESEPT